jgi:hypothetical protein
MNVRISDELRNAEGLTIVDAYGKRLHKAAREEFRNFWSAYRYWLVLATLIAVVLGSFCTSRNW